ncbi:MAG: hypothetical protein IJJ71_09925 [Treponema sp.]|uniref:hypothetical protein n=1 Tax=Treponema sp. TaxID=166 RepID=UPI0025E761BE|nr:hypothetical protein [Treponema sp.]MBR0496478.1 hypothetical protein [Treponema sp.]
MYITNSLLTEFDQELHDRCTMEFGYEQGVADGEARGAQQNAIANAKNFLQEGDSPEKVARCCSLPLEQVLVLKNEMVQA